MIVIAMWIVGILVGLGLLAMVVFGIRSLTYGKVSPISMVIVSLPVVLLLLLGFIMGDWTLAAIYTFLIMLALAMLSLLVTGVKGLFS